MLIFLADCSKFGAFGNLQIVVPLQVQPQLCGGTEERSEPKGRISRDATFPMNDSTNLSRRQVHRQGEFIRANQVRSREILQQDIARMNGR